MPPRETDVRKRTAIATANPTQLNQEPDFPDLDLNVVEEDLNLRVDAAVATLGEGLSELLRLSSVGLTAHSYAACTEM